MFPQFSTFPAEIRTLIWTLCLPRRVVEVFSPPKHRGGHDFVCYESDTNRYNGQSPVIMLVCREAARVAREHGSMVELGTSQFKRPTWIQPGRDLVLHRNDSENYWRDHPPPEDYFELNRRLKMRPSIMANHLAGFSLDALFATQHGYGFIDPIYLGFLEMPPSPWKPVRTIDYLIQEEVSGDGLLSVPLLFINMHIPESAVLASGLFGLLGDEPLQLVDVEDTVRIQKYSDLIRDNTDLGDYDIASLRDICYKLRDTTRFPARLQRWKEKADWLMLAHMWRRDKYDFNNNHFDGDSKQSKQDFYAAWTPPYADGPRLEQATHQINEENTWVLEARKQMWRPQPKIIIRLCRAGCGWRGERDEAGQSRDLFTPSSSIFAAYSANPW